MTTNNRRSRTRRNDHDELSFLPIDDNMATASLAHILPLRIEVHTQKYARNITTKGNKYCGWVHDNSNIHGGRKVVVKNANVVNRGPMGSIAVAVAAFLALVIIIVRRALLVALLLVMLLHRSTAHHGHLAGKRVFLWVRNVVFLRIDLLLENRERLDGELRKKLDTTGMVENLMKTYRDLLSNFLANESIADNEHSPWESSNIGRRLELQFVRSVHVGVLSIGVGNVGDLHRRYDNLCLLGIRENNPP